jgi:hypothetical protein
LIEFGWFKSFGCLDWVQEGGGWVEDEVEGFQVFAGFLKKVPQENSSIFFH